MEFHELIKKAREKRHATMRDFYEASDLPCTYFYYSKVEHGYVPKVEIALKLLEALGIDKRRGLMAWAKSQMPSQETKSFFAEFGEEDLSVSPEKELSASDCLVINRSQAAFLKTDPLLMEILTFINMYGIGSPVSVDFIADHFGMPKTKIKPLVENLYDQGLIDKKEDSTNKESYDSKRWIYLPFEYEPLKELNFKRSYQQYLTQVSKDRVRNSATIRITDSQRHELESRIKTLINWLVKFELEEVPNDAKPYTVGFFGSPRRFGNGK